MADIHVTAQAYVKMLLHAAKFPHCAVNGLLLANTKKLQNSKTVEYVDCIPLFHINLGLSPMLEVALTQVDFYCKKNGLTIAGYYQANENLRDLQPDHVAIRISDKIHHHCKEANMFMLDNTVMNPECEREVFHVFHHQEGKWKAQPSRSCLDPDALAQASSMLKSKAYRNLVDFDNHLDDISQDWTNPQIHSILQQLS